MLWSESEIDNDKFSVEAEDRAQIDAAIAKHAQESAVPDVDLSGSGDDEEATVAAPAPRTRRSGIVERGGRSSARRASEESQRACLQAGGAVRRVGRTAKVECEDRSAQRGSRRVKTARSA